MKSLNKLLAAVSRSFYLSMRFLPVEMRAGVSVAYLLARATDTVADSVDMPMNERLVLLKMMSEIIEGRMNRDDATVCFGRLGSLGGEQKHRGEGELLCRFPECIAQLEALPQDQQDLVREVLRVIVSGQTWDLEYFETESAVMYPEQLERYTYMVAGCVGEFWTRLGILTIGEKFSTKPEGQLLSWGRHYGMALQLVNILRDREEDLSRGRSYLPDGDIETWFQKAESGLREGVYYADSLRLGRLRFSTLLPAQLGLDTLALLKQTPDEQGRKVKVARKQVYAQMWQAFLFAWKKAM